MLDINDLQLDEFAEYLIRKSLCKDGHAKYYVYWVKNFFREAQNWPPDAWELLLRRYVNTLNDNSEYEAWQVDQADKSVRLYFHNFRSGDSSIPKSAAHMTFDEDGCVVTNDLLSSIRQSLRIQHYSYRTEQTYLDWIRRFLVYVDKCYQSEERVVNGDGARSASGRPRDADSGSDLPAKVLITEQLIKDYIAWLALQRNVASSTQNQAFNALLFMARSALNLELSGLEKGVRAKVGKKLPVVLTPEEVKKVLSFAVGTRELILKLMYGGGLRLRELW
jgi:hypothetical protein